MTNPENGRLRGQSRKQYREARARAPEPVSLEDRLRARATPGAIEFVSRVSSPAQRNNLGSRRAQILRGKRYLEDLGIDVSKARETQWIESAKGDFDRVHFEALLGRLSRYETRILAVGTEDRLARNSDDGVKLVNLVKDVEAMIVVGEQPYDPRTPAHHAYLLREIVEAELDNANRAVKSAGSREELARTLSYRRILPTGLCWVAKTDPHYEAMAEQAGIGTDLLSDGALEAHRTNVEKHGALWYVRFDPHKDVYVALQMILRWLFETGSVAAVMEKIRSDPAYPRRGLVPKSTPNTFQRAVPPHWRIPYKGWLEAWLKSEAIFGIYSYSSLAGMREYGKRGLDVFEPGAFPSFLMHADVARVSRILSNVRRPWKEGSYTGPRNDPIPLLRCANLMPDGDVCGRSMSAVYGPKGQYKYVCGDCTVDRKKWGKVHAHVGRFVVALLERLFEPDAMEGVQLAASGDLDRHRAHVESLNARLEALAQKRDGAMDLQAEARAVGNTGMVNSWTRRLESYEADRRQLEQEQTELDQEGHRLQPVPEAALARLKALAGDLPQLLKQARACERAGRGEGIVREIVEALVSEVHVRVLRPTLYQVSLAFPSGETVTGLVTTARTRPTAQERAYIAVALAEGWSPDWIAGQLTRYRKLACAYYQGGSRRGPWAADAVVAVDLVHPDPRPRKRKGIYRTAMELADRVFEPVERVKAAILAGQLGPAEVTAGAFSASPTDNEVARAFRGSGPKRAAAATGWPADQVCTITDLVVESGVRRNTVMKAAGRLGAVAYAPPANTPVLHRERVLLALEPLRMDPDRHVPSDLRHLPAEHWKTRTQLFRELPNQATKEVCRRAPRFSHAPADVYFHASPALVHDVLLGNLPQVLRDGGYGHLRSEDFMHQKELLAFLRERCGAGSPGSLRTAVERGAVLRVEANRPGNHGVYYWVPSEVRQGRSPELVWDWFGGRFPPSPDGASAM
jgi:hypothetical protein